MRSSGSHFLNLILITLMLCACVFPTEKVKEVHLIPKGYFGEVQIVYNVPSGVEKEHTELGERVYRIDTSGALITRFEHLGVRKLNDEYYFINPDGTTNRIFSSSDTILNEYKFNEGEPMISNKLVGKTKFKGRIYYSESYTIGRYKK